MTAKHCLNSQHRQQPFIVQLGVVVQMSCMEGFDEGFRHVEFDAKEAVPADKLSLMGAAALVSWYLRDRMDVFYTFNLPFQTFVPASSRYVRGFICMKGGLQEQRISSRCHLMVVCCLGLELARYSKLI